MAELPITGLTLTPQKRGGNPSKLTPETTAKLVEYLSRGNYIRTACEASGIDYSTLRQWIGKAEEDRRAGRHHTRHTELADALTRARAAAEARLVAKLDDTDDWRAAAFKLERGPGRERWGKNDTPVSAGITIQLPAELAGVLADAMRVGQAQVIELPASHVSQALAAPTIDAELAPAPEPQTLPAQPEPVSQPREVTTVSARRR